MMETSYEKMEKCLKTDQSEPLIESLHDADWRVRYAAAIALGDRREPAAVSALLEVLAEEDAAPLYAQPEVSGSALAGDPGSFAIQFPDGTTESDVEAYRRRGRLKQAVCLALGSIGVAESAAVSTLSRYATDAGEDYTVRAAACKALGQLASQKAVPSLQKASGDEEWCTRTEALKALKLLVK